MLWDYVPFPLLQEVLHEHPHPDDPTLGQTVGDPLGPRLRPRRPAPRQAHHGTTVSRQTRAYRAGGPDRRHGRVDHLRLAARLPPEGGGYRLSDNVLEHPP